MPPPDERKIETAVPEADASLLDTAPCGFVSFDDTGRVLYANSTLAERLGYDREQMERQHVEKLLALGSRIFYQTHFFPLVKLRGQAREVFLLFRTGSGEDVGMLCNAIRRQRNGAFVTDCVLMEVVERKKFEDALLQARQQADAASQELAQQGITLQAMNEELQVLNEDLERQREEAHEANQAKSRFLAVMSHELRTPLNAISGYVQLLDMEIHGPVTEPQREALGRIDKSQRHLLRLINDVLNLSRIEAGRVDYEIETVPIKDLTEAVMPMIEPQARSGGLALSFKIDDSLSATVDREKAEQILLNLLTNAIKFTAPGGSVTVAGGEKSPSRAYVRITDTGLGIPAAMVDRIFEPFIQVDSSSSRATEGTGLGLAISRDLARGMGGDLTVTSVLGEGSSFELVLPRGPSVVSD